MQLLRRIIEKESPGIDLAAVKHANHFGDNPLPRFIGEFKHLVGLNNLSQCRGSGVIYNDSYTLRRTSITFGS